MRVRGRERIDNREAIARHGEGGRGRPRVFFHRSSPSSSDYGFSILRTWYCRLVLSLSIVASDCVSDVR